ncbi:hypothetical protein BDZ45DRAFT_731737 [Acephala macrosclerotiorum]|nr:hypothetical protein BDZ45DRAFT_731737 [Acephala macrosclerotiorum]
MSSIGVPVSALNNKTSANPTFTCFPNLPRELRLVIWEAALQPRIIPLRQTVAKNKTIGEWEDENNALWPVLDGIVVPRPPGHFSFEMDDHGFYERTDHLQGLENECAYVRNELRYRYIFEEQREIREDPGDAAVVYRRHPLVDLTSEVPLPRLILACREAYWAITNLPRSFTCGLSTPKTYFNFDSDTLFLRYDIYGSGHPSRKLEGVDILICDLWGGFRIEDARKVRRLALLLDWTKTTILSWIKYLLMIFSFLKELILVVNNHLPNIDTFYPAYPLPKDTSPITFSDTDLPEDPHQALKRWDDYDPAAELDHFNIRMPLLYMCSLPPHLAIDVEDLKQLHQEDQQKGIIWSIPTIEFKIAIKEELKQQLHDAEKSCQQRIEVELRRRYAQIEWEERLRLAFQRLHNWDTSSKYMSMS